MQIMIIHILTVSQKLTGVDNVTDRQTDEEDETVQVCMDLSLIVMRSTSLPSPPPAYSYSAHGYVVDRHERVFVS